MSGHWPKSGPNSAAEYMVSGLPYALTGSGSSVVHFPYLTMFILVKSTGGNVTVGFTANGLASDNKFTVLSSGSVGPLDIRVKDLFMAGGNWEVVAGLTMVERTMFPTLTESSAPGIAAPYANSDDFGYDGIG